MSVKESLEAFRDRPWGHVQSRIEVVNEVRPVDLFCYLAAAFGPPNGMANFLRGDHSDNLIHWEWVCRHPGGVVVFAGTNFRTDILIAGIEPSPTHLHQLSQQFKAAFASAGAGMTGVRQQLEQWTEFVNPYQRIRRAIDRLLYALDKLNLDPAVDKREPLPAHPSTAHEAESWQELASRYSQGLGLCFGVRAMVPVMAEAFVNLLLYILMRPEIRKDARMVDNMFRQPIDIRVKSLQLNCVGFATQPDYATEPCKNYQTLVNQRNDLLHGNVVLDKLKFNEVHFWGKVPVFKEYRSFWDRSLQLEADAVGLDAVRKEVETVEALVQYLLSCLEPSLRDKIDFIAKRHELGIERATQRIGVLFPGWLVDFRPGPTAPSVPTEPV
jgi:hypothetical protein